MADENTRDHEKPTITSSRAISAVINDLMADVPRELIAALPEDGASQHDHYIYGWPKRTD